MLFSACVDVEVSSEYRLDGSASHAVQIQIDHVPADRTEKEDMDDILHNLEQRATDAGLEFERIDEAGGVIVRISGTTAVGVEAGAGINSLINATGLNATPGVAAPFRGTFQRETGAIGGTVYTLDMSVDGEMLFDSIVIEQLGDDEERRQAVSMFYVASFPGDVTQTTGEILDSSTVRWNIPFDTVTELSVTARTGGAGSAALFILVGIAAILVITVIAIVIGKYLTRQKRFSTALSGGIHRIPGQQTITHEGQWVARKVRGFTERLDGARHEPPADER
jgi:hypothetical protein